MYSTNADKFDLDMIISKSITLKSFKVVLLLSQTNFFFFLKILFSGSLLPREHLKQTADIVLE